MTLADLLRYFEDITDEFQVNDTKDIRLL